MQHKTIIASFIFLATGFISVAQDVPQPPAPPPPPGLPIDNGIWVLVIFALVYGVYKIIKLSKPVS